MISLGMSQSADDGMRVQDAESGDDTDSEDVDERGTGGEPEQR